MGNALFTCWEKPCLVSTGKPLLFVWKRKSLFLQLGFPQPTSTCTWHSPVNKDFFLACTEVCPVDAHRRYPCWCWLRFSYGTNSPRITLLNHQRFIRVDACVTYQWNHTPMPLNWIGHHSDGLVLKLGLTGSWLCGTPGIVLILWLKMRLNHNIFNVTDHISRHPSTLARQIVIIFSI